MRVAWLPRTLLASLVVVVVVLCAGLAPSPAAATEEPADDADGDATITTTLYPRWNMVGWVGPETPASELFDELPALGRIFAWDAGEQRYLRLMPSRRASSSCTSRTAPPAARRHAPANSAIQRLRPALAAAPSGAPSYCVPVRPCM